MAEKYKKVGSDLEITTTNIRVEKRQHLLEDKERLESDIVNIQHELDEVNTKLAIINK